MKQDIFIKNGQLILNDEGDTIKNGSLYIVNGKIKDLGKIKSPSNKSSNRIIINAKNNYISPGFHSIVL